MRNPIALTGWCLVLLFGGCSAAGSSARLVATVPPQLIGVWVEVVDDGAGIRRTGHLGLGRARVVADLALGEVGSVVSTALIFDAPTGTGTIGLPDGRRLVIIPARGLAKLGGSLTDEPTISPSLLVRLQAADGTALPGEWRLWPDTTVALAEAGQAYRQALASLRTGGDDKREAVVAPSDPAVTVARPGPVDWQERLAALSDGEESAGQLAAAADRGPAAFADALSRLAKAERYRILQAQFLARRAGSGPAAEGLLIESARRQRRLGDLLELGRAWEASL